MKYRNGKCYDDFGNEMSQSQINSLYKSSQAYIQKLNENKQIPQRELTKLIQGHRELHGVPEQKFNQIIPQSITGDKGIAVVLRDEKTKYTEIYVKNRITKKMFFILQE